MTSLLLLLLSIFPGFIVIIYIYWRDRHDREPLLYLTICFLFGILSTYPAIKMEEFGIRDLGIRNMSDNAFMTFTFAFVVVAFSEEFVKFVFLRYFIFNTKHFDEPMDGIVYSIMISMGFATLENILYVIIRPENASIGFQIGLIRMFTAVPAHAIFAVLMGYFIGLAKFSEKRGNLYLIISLFSAIFLHGTYDFLIFMNLKQEVIWFTLIAGLFTSFFLLNKHQVHIDKRSEEIPLN